MFLNNGYPSSFFDKILASFQSSNKFSQNISFENSFCIPYLGKDLHHFANSLSALIKNKYNLKISPIYKTFKIVNYFQLNIKLIINLVILTAKAKTIKKYEIILNVLLFLYFD